MKTVLMAGALVAGLATAVAAQTGETIGSITIDDSFYIDRLDARGGIADIDIAVAFTQQNGRVVVCAATASQLSGTLSQIKRAIVVTEGGTRIMRGLQWSPNYPRGTTLIGQQAECQITGHPAVANPDFGLDLERNRF